MTPTLTAQNGNVLSGALPPGATGFTPVGDIQYGQGPINPPLNSAVTTSGPAADSYKQSVQWITNEQNQAAVRKANAALIAQTNAANEAAAAGKNKNTSVAMDALSGFQRTSNTANYSPAEQQRIDDIKKIGTQLSDLSTQMGSRAASQIDSVIKEYEGLTKRQETANTQYEGGVSTAGLASGRSRYAPEIQAGVQSAAVASGIQALTDIQNKKEKLISDIEQARDAGEFKVLTEKANELKTLQKDERDAATQMKTDFYNEQNYLRTNQDYVGKTLAPSIVGALTGDPTHDNQLYAQIADQNGVSQSSLMSAVDTYKQNLSKAEPSALQEYNFAKSQGFKGTFMDYQRASKAPTGGVGNTISINDAKTLGLPLSLVGLSEQTVVKSLNDPNPPEWYRTLIDTQGVGTTTEPIVKDMWNKYRQKAATDAVGANAVLNFGQ